jgi:hypothetical protein
MNKVKEYTEYMEKQADGGLINWASMSEAGQQLLKNLPYLLLVPAGAGVAGGYVASRMGSPTDSDVNNIQNEFLREKLRTHVAKRQRETDIAKQNAKSAKEKESRDLMI